jgi:N-acetyl-anhydromuramyl-L-alanine amidase AmpD
MDGSLASTDAWFSISASQVSAHYGVSLEGDFHCYVRREDTAWANGRIEPGNRWPGPPGVNPNWLSISIETEDLGDQALPVTTALYDTVRTLIRTVMATYPSIQWLIGHDTISPRSRPRCPGPRWRMSGELAQLATDAGLELI